MDHIVDIFEYLKEETYSFEKKYNTTYMVWHAHSFPAILIVYNNNLK